VVFFYFDPAKTRTPGEMGAAGKVLAARLFFCGRRRSAGAPTLF